jgi:hypothetical protein
MSSTFAPSFIDAWVNSSLHPPAHEHVTSLLIVGSKVIVFGDELV